MCVRGRGVAWGPTTRVRQALLRVLLLRVMVVLVVLVMLLLLTWQRAGQRQAQLREAAG